MATRSAVLAPAPRRLAVPVAMAGALVLGLLVARNVPVGVGLLLAGLAVPAVLADLPLGLALYAGLLFLDQLSAVSVAPSALGVLVLLAWLAGSPARRVATRVFVDRHRALLNVLALTWVWVLLSLSWAQQVRGGPVVGWTSGLLLFVVVATSVASASRLRVVALGFVGGAAVSTALGLAGTWLGAGSGLWNVTHFEGRLMGGTGDPNFLAAGIVPALVLAGGLLSGERRPWARWSLGATMALLAVGLVATESRGGVIAAAVVAVLAPFFLPGRRVQATVFVAFAVSVAAAWMVASPGAWSRISSLSDQGNGRSDIWRVALRMTADHPVGGVGLGDFRVRAGDYVRRPGTLRFVELIAERPHEAHNTYLEILAETGVVGLALFLSIALGALRAAWRAGRSLAAAGQPVTATLARATLLAQVGMLVAVFFISAGEDARLWLLLGLGPALSVLAARAARR